MKSLWIATLVGLALLCTMMMFELNNISRTLDHLTVTQEHSLRYAQHRLERAKLLEAQGELTRAQSEFERLANLSIPTVAQDAEVALNRLQIRRVLSDLSQVSLTDLDRLMNGIKSTPQLSQVWLNSLQFVVTLKQGLINEAIELGEGLIKDPAVSDVILVQYVQLLSKHKRADEAQLVLKAFLKQHSESSNAWASLGQLQQQQNKYSDAIMSYEKSLKIQPNPVNSLAIARLYMRQGNWKKASTIIDVNQFPESFKNEAFKLKAACNFQLKAYEKSAALYQKAYALTPDPNTLLSRVIALQVAGKYERALAAVERIMEHENELPHIHFHRAQILIGTGMTANAAKSFVDFLKLADNAPEHAKRVKHASKWLAQYQRSLIVPSNIQDGIVKPELNVPVSTP